MSIQPQDAPVRPGYIRDAAGLYYKIGVSGGLTQADGDARYLTTATADARYVNIDGDVMTGKLEVGPTYAATAFSTNTADMTSNIAANAFQARGAMASGGSLQALQFNADDTGANNTTSLNGVNGIATKTGSGLVGSLTALAGSARLGGTATATNLIAILATIRHPAGTAATTATALMVNAPVAGGTVTSEYGLKIAAMKGTGVTTGYGVASDGASDLNYFMGKVGVGKNAPAEALDVLGNIALSGVETITNASQLITPLVINRTATSTLTTDADTFVVNYLTERATWTNEKGNLRTSNKGSKAEVAFKIIGAATAEGGTGNMMEVLDIAGNIMTRIGPLGRQNFNKGIRMVGDTIEIRDSTEADQSTIAQILSGDLVVTPKRNVSLTGPLIAPAATTAITSIRLPHGVAPSAPTNGDLWTTSAGLYARINNGTVGPFGPAGAGGPPTGTAGGDLTGSYPNPTIAAGIIDNADISATAAIAQSKIATLVTDLAGKAASSHTHVIGDLPTGTSGTTVALGNHVHTGVYEASGAVATHAATAGHELLSSTAPAALGAAAAVGVGTTTARADHVHAYPTALNVGALPLAGGVMTGDLTLAAGPTQDYHAVTRAYAVGILNTHAIAANPHTVYQLSAQKDAASGYAGLDSGSKVVIGQVPTGTSSTTVALGNHLHTGVYEASGAVATHAATAGHEPLSSTTPAALGSAAVGVGTTTARADHVHAMPTAANVGAEASGAVATHDALTTAHAALRSAAVGTSIGTDTSSVGTSTLFARADHKHPALVAAPVALGVANAQGSSTNLARADHVHIFPTLAELGAAATAHTHTGVYAPVSHTHVATTDLTATGTKNSTTFLRGDNTWAAPPAGGGLDQATADGLYVNVTGDTISGQLTVTGQITASADLAVVGNTYAYKDFRMSATSTWDRRIAWTVPDSVISVSAAGTFLLMNQGEDTYRDLHAGAILGSDIGGNTVAAYTAPTDPSHLTRKDYVDARTPVIVKGTTAPSDLTAIWVDTN